MKTVWMHSNVIRSKIPKVYVKNCNVQKSTLKSVPCNPIRCRLMASINTVKLSKHVNTIFRANWMLKTNNWTLLNKANPQQFSKVCTLISHRMTYVKMFTILNITSMVDKNVDHGDCCHLLLYWLYKNLNATAGSK